MYSAGFSLTACVLVLVLPAALERFPSQPVGGAAEAFQSLLRMLGAEGAVESVLRALVSPVGGRSI